MFNRSKKHKQRNTAINCIKILPHQKKCFPLRKSNLNGIYWNMEKNIEISLLEPNKGQIKGLPRNPRTIKDKRFKALKKSIEDAPEMLALRELLVYPHNGKYVVIGGNMRLKACRELGYKELPCKVIDENTPVEKLREYTIKDNIGFGTDDWGALFDDWDLSELEDWGMELKNKKNPYVQKTDSPIYEIQGEEPTIAECINLEDVALKIDKINKAKISKEQKTMLMACAYRFANIHFGNMAEYYAHQNKEMQKLMEDLALVIVDFGKAIEMNLVEMDARMEKIYNAEL